MLTPDDIINFWFKDDTRRLWWAKSDEFDQLINQKFAQIHNAASYGELSHWRIDSMGRLAEIIILDQFSRNLFRDSGHAFAQDAQALTLAQEAVAQQLDQSLTPEQRIFLYMPYMHSESSHIHQQAVQLYNKLGLSNNLEFELKHQRIIDQFGRYPHRNAVLGRSSTAEEIDFLKQKDSSF